MKTVGSAILVGLAVLLATSVHAQPFRADAKITGAAFGGYAARTHQRHARDYSQMLYYAGRGEQTFHQQTATQHVAGVRKSVEAANKALDKVKEAHPGKPDVAKSIDKIKERHARVMAKCDELDDHVAKGGKDANAMCDCCMDVIEELDAATADTEKLLKDLGAHELPKPARSSAAAPKKEPAKKP